MPRCIHGRSDQDRRQGSWGCATGPADPAAGTLLPWLLPAWRGVARAAPARCYSSAPLPKTPRRSDGSSGTDDAASAGPSFWQPRRPVPSKADLMRYVDPPADEDSVDAHLEFIRDPYMRGYAPADSGPEVRVSQTREDDEFPTWQDLEQADGAVQAAIRTLGEAVWRRLRSPGRTSAAEVYEQYCRLPVSGAERMAHIPASLRHDLLKALGMVEKKDAPSMMRYFAVVADVKDAGFALWRGEWNAALSFASRYVGTSTAAEAEAAVQLWREMEQDAHVLGNEVTFNILFDVASKAGNFTLAELVYQEMERRGLRYNRYHHVSLIHFFGLRMDADGVRAAYRDMVEAGELVDVVVLNCLLVSFLRCGDEAAAEHVYQQMRASHLERAGASCSGDDDLTFSSQKAMTHVLMMLARVGRRSPDLRAAFQHLAPTRPDLATFRILVNHYAVRLGHLPSVTRLLRDMQLLRIPLHGTVFLALFKGFALHGGRDGSGTDWSLQRLRSIWAALLKALDDEAAGLYISTWLVVWVLRAFDRCGSPEMVFKAYNSLTSRWEPSEADADFTIGFLHSLLRGSRRRGVVGSPSSPSSPDRPSLLSQLGNLL